MKPAPYGPFPYSPIIRRPRLDWPDGAHVALWVIPNIEFFSLQEKVPAGSGLQETWDTLDLLAAEGCQYVSDWVNDDQPYVMTLEGGRRLVSMPYSQEINDKPAFERWHRSPDEFKDMICRQFDVLYREGSESGRVM